MPQPKRYPDRTGFLLRLTEEQRRRLEMLADVDVLSMTEWITNSITKGYLDYVTSQAEKEATPKSGLAGDT